MLNQFCPHILPPQHELPGVSHAIRDGFIDVAVETEMFGAEINR
jgi:hypothetical protein